MKNKIHIPLIIKRSAVLFLFCLFIILPVNNTVFASGKIKVTDTLGREVEIKKIAGRVIAVGPGALRLCCYYQRNDIIAGIEKMDIDSSEGRPYLIANRSLAGLPVIGLGGPNNSPDPEKIIAVKPDVIFSTYFYDKSSADNFLSKTGIPVVALSYGNVSLFDPAINDSLKLIGKITGMDERADEIIIYLQKCRDDLDSRTEGIPDSKKPTVYIGGLGMRGAHGIESTQANYSLFNAVNAKNVADETGKTGSVMIDKEKLIMWNPDKIFIDGAGLNILMQDYKRKPEYYKSLGAFRTGSFYLILPYNYYHTNIDTALADAYYMGKVLYPEKFMDIDPEKKADEIYETLLGGKVYSEMKKQYGGFKKIDLK